MCDSVIKQGSVPVKQMCRDCSNRAEKILDIELVTFKMHNFENKIMIVQT